MSEKHECVVCGRVGTRGFRVVPKSRPPLLHVDLGPYTLCENRSACLKRKHRNDPRLPEEVAP